MAIQVILAVFMSTKTPKKKLPLPAKPRTPKTPGPLSSQGEIPGVLLRSQKVPGKTNVRSEATDIENNSTPSKPSVRLRMYVSNVAVARIAIGDIVRALGNSTPGFVLLVLALPAFIPTGLPIAAPAGAAMMVIGALMMAGRTDITMPSWLAHRRLTRAQFGYLVKFTAPVMAWLEKTADASIGMDVETQTTTHRRDHGSRERAPDLPANSIR